MRQPRLVLGILLSALTLASCSEEDDAPATIDACVCNESEGCALSDACAEELQRAFAGCEALSMRLETGTTSTPTYLRPEPELNPSCTTWVVWDHELAVDAFAPYLTATGTAPMRCDLKDIAVPTADFDLVPGPSGPHFRTPRRGESSSEWYGIAVERCQKPANEAPEFMSAGEPCLSACSPGTVCAGEGAPMTRLCEPCTTSPCQGFYRSAFCASGAQLGYEDLPARIFDRLDVDVPAQDGLRQLLHEAVPCGAPLELTLQGEHASAHLLRSHGVTVTSGMEYEEAPDRALTWIVLQDEDEAPTVYRCDLSQTADLWMTLTLDESGKITNFDALKDGWLPTCEARTADAQAAGNACLKVEGHALSCGEGLRCETEALRPVNLVDRIGFCTAEEP